MSFKKIVALLLICISLFALSGCDFTRMSGPERALKNFESSFNERDMEGIIKIFKPSEQAKLKLGLELSKGAVNIAGGLLGVDGIGDLFSMEILGDAFGVAADDCYITIDVLSEEYNADQSRAIVCARITSGESEKIQEFEMQKISGKWYVDIDIDF